MIGLVGFDALIYLRGKHFMLLYYHSQGCKCNGRGEYLTAIFSPGGNNI